MFQLGGNTGRSQAWPGRCVRLSRFHLFASSGNGWVGIRSALNAGSSFSAGRGVGKAEGRRPNAEMGRPTTSRWAGRRRGGSAAGELCGVEPALHAPGWRGGRFCLKCLTFKPAAAARLAWPASQVQSRCQRKRAARLRAFRSLRTGFSLTGLGCFWAAQTSAMISGRSGSMASEGGSRKPSVSRWRRTLNRSPWRTREFNGMECWPDDSAPLGATCL